MWQVKSTGEEMTERLGRLLGEILLPGTVVALNGELGAGKTVFARGVASGLGVKETVSSPSFVLMNIYQGKVPLYHFDFYRLEEEEELLELGLEEYFYSQGVTLIEWAEKFPAALPETRLEIEIVKDANDLENSRIITFIARGNLPESLFEELRKVVAFGP